MANPKTRKSNINAPECNPMKALRTKLKACEPEIQNFVTALEAENLSCVKKIAKLQAENIKLNSWITILEEDTKKRCVHETPPIDCLQKNIEQLQELEKALEEQLKELKPKMR